MSVISTQGFQFKLVANGQTLDLFKDEEILISDNITGLFDIGTLPSDFSRQILLPGTKKNNAFFEHVYDISIDNPFLFATNQKVTAYLDFDGLYLATGYLQLNKVNVLENKFIESYEVSIFGTVSSFARDISRSTLNDLSTLNQYNHTSSFDNITGSWTGGLFNGDIVYPLADYGKGIYYDYNQYSFGVNEAIGALGVADFKPAIRIIKVLDAIFEQYGYTYESDFLTSSFFDDIYMICDRDLRYPVYDDIDLNTFGQIKIAPVSGSFTDITLQSGSYQHLVYENVEYDPEGRIDSSIEYNTSTFSAYRGKIKIVCQVSGSELSSGSFVITGSAGVPQFNLQAYRTSGTPGNIDNVELEAINNYFREWSSTQKAGDKTHEVEQEFVLNLVSGSYQFRLKYEPYGDNPDFSVVLNPNSNTDSYLSIEEVTNAADLRVMNIPQNMPYGQSGIKQIDFIKGLQQKYNLVIYPSKTKPNHFIIDTFNNWYKKGVVKSFDNFIDVSKSISVTPANNLAVNKLEFGGVLGKDLLAQNFDKENNRNFGKSIYIDNQNFFSQGELKVEPVFSESPLRYVQGTGVSGSYVPPATGTAVALYLSNIGPDGFGGICTETSYYTRYIDGPLQAGTRVFRDLYLTQPETSYSYIADFLYDVYVLDSSGVIQTNLGNCRDYERD